MRERFCINLFTSAHHMHVASISSIYVGFLVAQENSVTEGVEVRDNSIAFSTQIIPVNRKQLQQMLFTRCKAEIEILSKSSYSTECPKTSAQARTLLVDYLSCKLSEAVLESASEVL